MRTTPPFRADHVGSLLRTAPIKEARLKREKGQIEPAAFKEIENREIEKIIAKQKSIGLQLATDGEFRRAWWHFDFYGLLDGIELREVESGIQFQGVQTKAQAPHIVGPLGFPSTHPMLEHFRFLKAHGQTTPKMTIPSPNVLHFRLASVNTKLYPDREALFAALADVYRQAVRAFYEAGCRYLQFDDTAWAYLCSKDEVQKAKQRGTEVENLPEAYARMINRVLEAKPKDMVITTHICRGNFRSTWITSGGYEPVAEVLFGSVNYDGYFLEYDSDRAGGFEPLRFLPKGKKQIVLGLITTKTGTLEKKDDIKRRIGEAQKYVALDQLCLSPQCGFASTEEGNILAEDEQWKKLSLAVEIANEMWG
ncbi:MAG: 5-methyltetrahydropteroyltriglutamate--homocysteine methyltransferase [Alphaproteobacteria bacterium]|jgi:5-methyltetrahydropteroyltriglutamate--homocysteine methyltransferase|nr:5-methyltetrahydropteroyltriglutamate--homocysteine methyltransferase [Alphaproteobacteria bacterium]